MRRTWERVMLAALLGTSAVFMAMAIQSAAGQPLGEIETEEIKLVESGVTAASKSTTQGVVIKTGAEAEAEVESESETKHESAAQSNDWGVEDTEILLQIAMAEAEAEGIEGKALVILVVLNRVRSDDFPDSIEAVVMQDGQFSTVADGGRYYTTTPDEECYEALGLVCYGWDESQGALYFESCKGVSWHEANLTYLFQYGGHRFYK